MMQKIFIDFPTRIKKMAILLVGIVATGATAFGQDSQALLQKLKEKLEQVNSYEAEAIMKTNVSFLKVPDAQIKVYYRKPDKLKIKNENGISLIPKGSVGITLTGLLEGKFTAIDAGMDMVNGTKVKVLKLLPADENAEVVLSTIYVDETRLLILKAKTTTRENGTYQVDMVYGKYANLALPDQVTCTFNTRDYKLPKGITFDYDDGSRKQKEKLPENTTGKVEIRYTAYAVNKKIPDSVF